MEENKNNKGVCRGTAAGDYDDIIHLKRPESERPKMDPVRRAKIFSPYDALRGFDEEIADADREIRKLEEEKRPRADREIRESGEKESPAGDEE